MGEGESVSLYNALIASFDAFESPILIEEHAPMTDIVEAVAREIARKVFVTVPEAMPAAQAAIAAMQPYIDAARIEGATRMHESAFRAVCFNVQPGEQAWFARDMAQDLIAALDPAAVCKEK